MVLVGADTQPTAVREFEAEVVIMNNASTIRVGYQAVIHCGVIRQTAHILEMDKEYLRLQEKGHVKFKFMSRPEFLKDGSTILFREGKT